VGWANKLINMPAFGAYHEEYSAHSKQLTLEAYTV
jgi:hypothetical protein